MNNNMGSFHNKVWTIRRTLVQYEKKNETRKKVFHMLLKEMNQYANLFSLVCAMAIEDWLTDEDRQTFSSFINSSTDNGLDLSKTWFIWPLCTCISLNKSNDSNL